MSLVGKSHFLSFLGFNRINIFSFFPFFFSKKVGTILRNKEIMVKFIFPCSLLEYSWRNQMLFQISGEHKELKIQYLKIFTLAKPIPSNVSDCFFLVFFFFFGTKNDLFMPSISLSFSVNHFFLLKSKPFLVTS